MTTLANIQISTAGGRTLPSLSSQVVLPPRRKVPVEVDLAITIDRTGSSEAFEKGIRMAAPRIAQMVAEKAARVRCFLQTHGDLDYDEHPVMLTAEGSIEAMASEVQNIRFGGGGDAPEHHLDGVEHLHAMVPWRGNQLRSRGCILLFATDDTKPLRSGASARALGERLRDDGVLLYVICQPTPQLRELAEAADGMVFPISNAPSEAEMRSIAERVAASISASLDQGATQPG